MLYLVIPTIIIILVDDFALISPYVRRSAMQIDDDVIAAIFIFF